MMRALFTATSGMIVQERKQANVVSNLSNIGTTGFKVEDLITKEVNQTTIQNRERLDSGNTYMRKVGRIGLGTEIDELYVDFQQGVFEETNKDTDFALDGDGFFKIQWSENEIGYTKNGQFQIDGDGYLSTLEGKRVLGRNNRPMQIGDEEMTVSEEGEIYVDGDSRFTFALVKFDNPEDLEPIGASTYRIKDGREIQAKDTKVLQRTIEKSNVNPLEEIVKMIEITRTYESNQKVIQSLDRVLDKSVNQIGKV